MDSFELNKILGAVLGTCLLLLSLNITAGAIFSPAAPAKPGYEIAVPDQAAGTQTAGGPAQPEQPIEVLLASASVERGETAHKVCMTCHTVEKGGPTRTGPNLWGVVGRPKASVAGFNYSAAMKAKGGEWTLQDLNAFLAAPRQFVPGTNMSYAGMTRPNQRADLLAYLNSLSDSPKPLPTATQATAPAAPAQPQPANSGAQPNAPAGSAPPQQ